MLLKLISPSFCSPLGSSSLITVYSLYRLSSSLARRPFAVAAMSSSTSTPMNPPTHTSPSPPAGLAPIEGLPIAAQAVLHRELCHIHSSLQLILTILRGPWDTLAPPLADTITCPLLLAHLRGLDASIDDQTKRATCTTLAYTEQLLTALGLLHTTRFDRDHTRLIAELRSRTAFLDPPVPSTSPFSLPPPLFFSPPSSLPDPLTPTSTPSTGSRPPVVTTPFRLYSTTSVSRPATTLMRTTRSRSRSPSIPR